MLFLLTTWVTQRIVGLVAVLVISVSTFPTTLILVTNHESEQTIRAQLVQQVWAESEETILQIHAAEQACDGQLQQLTAATTAKPATLVRQLIVAGEERHHTTVLGFVEQVRAEEGRVRGLKDLDDDDVQVALGRIHLIANTAMGPNGAVPVNCQSILSEIPILIQAGVVPPDASPVGRRHRKDGD